MFTEEAQQFMKRWNHEGGPVPPVDPDALRRMWQAMQKAEGYARTVGTRGLVAVAGPRSTEGGPGVRELHLMFRGQLLSSLVKREVLREYVADETLNDDVFRTAATMPLDKHELDEALTLLYLTQSPEDVRSSAMERLKAAGYDSNCQKIDTKFLRTLTASI